MPRPTTAAVLLAALAALSITCPAGADVRLAKIFTDGMVLQRDMPVPVWGWAQPGEKVTVTLDKQSAAATADEKGKWMVRLEALKAGGAPLEMTVAGTNTLKCKDILVGEVWVGSGQSNMQMNVSGVRNAAEEIAASENPKIRLFTVDDKVAGEPVADLIASSGWQACGPKTVGGFSAVAYFFGRDLAKKLDVPIGLIHTSWGGTPAESWTSMPALKSIPSMADRVAMAEKSITNYPEAGKEYQKTLAEWQKKMDAAKAAADVKGDVKDWHKADYDAKDWKLMKLPQYWESTGLNIDGAVWFRKEVQVPAAWAGKDLNLSLGPIDDDDVTYFNGEQVGDTKGYNLPRRYTVPGKLVKAGRNVIAVRVFDSGGGGGIYGEAKEMTLAPAGGAGGGAAAEAIGLAGEWQFKVEFALIEKPAPPMGPDNPWLPSGLYNAMIHPLIPYAIRGAIWYQGESNADRAYQYRQLFADMIRDWRKNWGQGDFPFAWVQLANLMAPPTEPRDSMWAELREAQTMTLALPATGQAVIIDIGDAKDIHPKNKQDVGGRLALWALAKVYGEKIEYSGPMYKSMAADGAKIRVSFDHVGGGLVARGGALKTFEIAAEDHKFVWADAKIDGETVVVSSNQVAKPVAVRYAWADNPDGCNLYNKEGIPASPFRTDTWAGLTAEKK
jgi:sialate O-acetylesterase